MSQLTLFGRGSSQVCGGDSVITWTTTGAFRRSLMEDFKVRALCPTKKFFRSLELPAEFPSHYFLNPRDEYVARGDDGTQWEIGSRGNDLQILRQEILNNEFLLPEEKAEILSWLEGDRKLSGATEAFRFVDGYFCARIRHGPSPTVAEIQASGLPESTIANLLYNLANYHPLEE